MDYDINNQKNKTLDNIQKYLSAPGMSAENMRKHLHLLLSYFIVVPILSIFVILDFLERDIRGGIIDFSIIFFLSLFVLSLKFIRNAVVIYRVIAFLLVPPLVYYAADSGIDGDTYLWLFPYPIFILFLLGKREGLFWIFTLILPSFILIMYPQLLGTHKYNLSQTLRIIAIFSIITFFSYTFESLRENFYDKLEKAKAKVDSTAEAFRQTNMKLEKMQIEKEKTIEELQLAIKEIKILSGMLPICANCKKIRDDKGYWNQIEEYISAHSNADFSHGICPECAKKLYPEVFQGDSNFSI